MYANDYAYNNLTAFLEKHEFGWTADTALANGNRLIDVTSKAFFQRTLATWTISTATACYLIILFKYYNTGYLFAPLVAIYLHAVMC